MGYLIVIEGLDGSGKKTQVKLLIDRLRDEGYDVYHLDYPNYESKSSELVKMYLQGEISKDANDINPYLSSLFYASDRGISYIKEWKKDYMNKDTIFIADRYTTSNMLYQAAKIKNKEEKDKYLDWLWDLEFNKIGLPVPDKVIFLDVNNDITKELTEDRPNKIDNGEGKDIHEMDLELQKDSYENAKYLVDKYGWVVVNCVDGDMKDKESIHDEIYNKVILEIDS